MITLLPSREGFLTQLQETGRATVSITALDDLVVATRVLVALSDGIGVRIRIFLENPNTLTVEVR